jgi:hypothetical protein
MPNKFNENELKLLVAKYIHSVRRDPANVPNIKNIVNEALKKAAPNRDIDEADVTSVLSNLSKRQTINDNIIHEAAKKVVDHSAMEDLKFVVGRNLKQSGKKASAEEIEKIISASKLDPHSSTIEQIRNAVKSYYTTGKPLENYSSAEINKLVGAEIGKRGSYTDQDLQNVTRNYLSKVDKEKPFDQKELESIVNAYQQAQTGIAPEPTPPTIGPVPTPVSKGRGKGETKHDVKQGAWVKPKDPKNLTFFDKIRSKLNRYGIKSLTSGARNWLTDSIYNVSKTQNRKKLLAEGETAAEAFVGKMFLYFYDAKTKKVLPYWDKFPLIFVIELYEDGWLGINLHYLPLQLRAALFDKLLQFADDKTLDKITKLRLSYALLKNVSQYPEVRPCIKRYLSGYVRSELRVIDAADWEIAMFLPVEQFQKETKEYVWGESKKIIRKLKTRR